MSTVKSRDATVVLETDFLTTRGRILEVAAALDRLDRSPISHGVHPDPRMSQLRRALEVLLEPGPDRVETIQMIFSREYDPRWREAFHLTPQERGHS